MSADPTKQHRSRRKALKSVIRKLVSANNRINAVARGLSVNLAVTDYNVTAQGLQDIQLEIEGILNQELLGSINGELMPSDWFYKDEIETPYRAGTVETVNETNHLIDAAILALLFKGKITPRKLTIQEVLLSSEYRELLDKVYIKNFQTLKSLSKNTAEQIIQTINSGIDAGKSRREIIKEINARFSVSKSRAKRIVNTEVNKAYNDAKIDSAALIEKETGVKTKVRHISALLPTTRPHHAARHRKIYTRAEQTAWWDSGVNRINCYCKIETVLVNSKGREINNIVKK